MRSNRRYSLFLCLAIASFVGVIFAGNDASAAMFKGYTSQKIVNQSYAQGLYKCYTMTNGTDSVVTYYGDEANPGKDDPQMTKTGIEDGGTYFWYKTLFKAYGAQEGVLLPNKLTPESDGIYTNDKTNCMNLISGFSEEDARSEDYKGHLDGFGGNPIYARLGMPESIYTVKNGSDQTKKDKFMEGMGFTGTKTKGKSGPETCYALNYGAVEVTVDSYENLRAGKWLHNYVDSEITKADGDSQASICVTVDESGKITDVYSKNWVPEQYGYETGHGGEYLLAYAEQNYTDVHFQIWSHPDSFGNWAQCEDSAEGDCISDYNIFGEELGQNNGTFDAKGMTLDQFEAEMNKRIKLIDYTHGKGAIKEADRKDVLALVGICQSNGYFTSCDPDDGELLIYENNLGRAVGIIGHSITNVTNSDVASKTWNLTGDGNNALAFIYNNSTLDDGKNGPSYEKIRAGNSYKNTAITESQKRVLYQYYLASPMLGNADIRCDISDEELEYFPFLDDYPVVWFNKVDEKKTCYVTSFRNDMEMDDQITYHIVDANGYFTEGTIMDVINALKTSPIDTLTDIDPADVISADDAHNAFFDSITSGGTTKEDCFSGAGSLGWIICPIIFDMSSLIKDKYAEWVEPALQINTQLFGANGDAPAYIAWSIFRDIANVAFVIVFIVVIFSQLTGVGIDNYGIKKILPKLIIGAILINASYIICQLAIDVANIIGYGVAGVFQWVSNKVTSGMPTTLMVEGVEVNPKDAFEGTPLSAGVAGVGAIVVLIVGVITTAAVLWQGGIALIIPVLLAILGIAISFFTLIAILGMRQAAAVLLVVASPLAFVAYMLPNTKKLFDKWSKAFLGLLVAFPACSALIYGGDMVGRILLSTSYGSTWIMISAAVVSIAPVFFIPKLIRNSMGAVSNAAMNFSHGLSKRARDAGNNSRLQKDIRANQDWNRQHRAMLRRAGLDENYNETARGRRRRERLKSDTFAGSRMARARAAALSEYSEMAQGNRMLGRNGMDEFHNQMYAIQGRLQDASISGIESQIALGKYTMTNDAGREVTIDPNNMEQLKNALIKAILNGEADKQKALINALSAKGDKGRETVRDAVSATEEAASSMSTSELSALRASHKNVAAHIMDKFAGAYKENNRTMYDWAASHQSETPGFNRSSVDSKQQWIAKNGLNGKFNHMAVQNVKGTQLLGMDDKEFERLAKSRDDMSTEERTELTKAITVALSSEAAVGAKTERIAQLKDLADKLGMVQGPKPPAPTA